jgi:hypothetical protein
MLLVNDTPLSFLVSSENLLHSRTINQRRTRRPNYNPDLPTYIMNYCDNANLLPRNCAPIPHFPRIRVSATPHPKTLELCSYSSSDSTLHVLKNLLSAAVSSTSLSLKSSLRINYALLSLPGGPPAIFTTFNQATGEQGRGSNRFSRPRPLTQPSSQPPYPQRFPTRFPPCCFRCLRAT